MKKFLSIILTGAILLSCGVAAYASTGAQAYYETEVLSENFETNNVWINLGYNYQNQNQSAGIAETHNIKADSPTSGDGHGKVFRATIPQTSATGDGKYSASEQHTVWTTKAIPKADELYFSFDVYMTERARLDIGFRVDDTTKWLTVARMFDDGRLTREDGTKMLDWNTDTWYTFKIHLDLKNQNYSMSVNDIDCANYRPFVNTKNVSVVNRLELTIQNTQVSTPIAAESEYMYLDNINIGAASIYAAPYNQSSGYTYTAFQENFDASISASSDWQNVAATVENVQGKNGVTSGALKLEQNKNARMNYSAAATTPILKNYTSEELERIKISFDFKVTEKGTSNFVSFAIYDAYSEKMPALFSCNNNGYLYSMGSYQGNGIVKNPGYKVNTWSSAEIYIDAKNKKMTIDIDGETFVKDADLTNTSLWGTADVRVDAIWFMTGTGGVTYVDNFKYEVMVPELKTMYMTNTAGTVSYTYSPDLLKVGESKAPNSAALIIMKKKDGKLQSVDIEPVVTTKLLSSELTGKGNYAAALTDAIIEARHSKTVKFNFEKAADEDVEIFLWDSMANICPILSNTAVSR